MGEYEELVELGFEGVDKFADKFHDPCHDYIDKKRPHWHNRKGKQGNENNQAPPPQQAHSEVPEEYDRGLPRDRPSGPPYEDENSRGVNAQAPERRRDSHRGEDGGRDDRYGGGRDDWYGGARDDRYGRATDNRYGATDNRYGATDNRYGGARGGGFDNARPGTVAPLPQMAYAPRPLDASHGAEFGRRRPLPPRRRESSYSPPHRAERRRSHTPTRQRKHSTPSTPSKSSRNHRMAATLVGALAGGAIGNASDKTDKWNTIAGALIGGLGGMELEKVYERRKDGGTEGR